jgi:hypothetical protein
VKRGFVDHRKIVPLKYITLSRVEISQFFTRRSFPQNICKTCANTLVVDLRFLWKKLDFKEVFSFSSSAIQKSAEQGDQIRRIFSHWAIVYFGLVFLKSQK